MTTDEQMECAQLKKLNAETAKLEAETESLRSSNRWENRITRFIPVITALIAVASFWFGIYQFSKQKDIEIGQQRTEIEKLQREFNNSVEISEKEFRRKVYEKQLEVYFDLTKTAAQISTVEDSSEIKKLHQHFLELYDGNLRIVQYGEVMNAAEQFERAFNEFMKNPGSREELRTAARALSEACRNSIKAFWKIPF